MGVFTDQTPTSTAGAEDTVCLGTAFYVDTPCTAVGVRYWKTGPTWDGHPIAVGLWSPSTALLGQGTRTQLADDPVGWVTVPLTVPPTIDLTGADQLHTVGYLTGGTDLGGYGAAANGLAAPIHEPPFHTPAAAGRYDYASSLPIFAPANVVSTAYFADIVTAAGAELATAGEVDQAQPVTGRKSAALGTAVETDTALSLYPSSGVQPGTHTVAVAVAVLTTAVVVSGLEVS
jgi:hypothetical protein